MTASSEPTQYTDAVHMAAQLGRLDFISALLACVGVVLVIGGVFAYIDLRATAKRIAREEARKQTEEAVERIANEYLQAELPDLLKEYSYLFGVDGASDAAADNIADVQEE